EPDPEPTRLHYGPTKLTTSCPLTRLPLGATNTQVAITATSHGWQHDSLAATRLTRGAGASGNRAAGRPPQRPTGSRPRGPPPASWAAPQPKAPSGSPCRLRSRAACLGWEVRAQAVGEGPSRSESAGQGRPCRCLLQAEASTGHRSVCELAQRS